MKIPVAAVLDADVFVKEQYDFTRSRRFKALIDRVQKGHLRLFLTDVTDREVRAGITRRVAEAIGVLNREDFQKKTRILQGSLRYTQLQQKPQRDELWGELLRQYDDYCRLAAIEIIDTSNLIVGPIMDAYFAETAPFAKSEQKKYEFPDAVSVAGAAAWSAQHGELVVVSHDSGVADAARAAPGLIPVKSLDELFDDLVVGLAAGEKVTRAHATFTALVDEISTKIADQFSSLGFSVASDEFENPYVGGVTVHEVRLEEPTLTEVTADEARFSASAEVHFAAEVEFDDPEAIVYAEGDRYVFNQINGTAIDSAFVEISVVVALSGEEASETDLLDVDIDATGNISVSMDNFAEDGALDLE